MVGLIFNPYSRTPTSQRGIIKVWLTGLGGWLQKLGLMEVIRRFDAMVTGTI
jgi:hypothetical protein